MLHAEALLLVYDEQAQVFEHDVLREQTMGPDDDVDFAARDLCEDLLLFLGRAKSAQCADAHGVVREALLKSVPVLLHQDCRRRQHCDLLPVLDRFEGRPDRDLGLAVADVSADEAVHGPRGLHVSLHVFAGLSLIRCILVQERGLHLHLPARVFRKGEPRCRLPPRIELEQLDSHGLDDLFGLPFLDLPPLATDAVDAWRLGVVRGTDPALDQIEPVDRKAQQLATTVLDRQRFDLFAGDLEMLQTDEAPHAMIHVDYVVSGGQLREALQRHGPPKAAAAAHPARSPEDLVVVEHAQRRVATGKLEPGRERPQTDARSRREPLHASENLLEPLDLTVVVTEQEGIVAGSAALP